jgi:hypothetical protein
VLALPDHGAPLDGVELVLVRRLADRERLDVGLVTADRDLARLARAVGLPAFSSVGLAEHFRPGWWRAGRRTERIGFALGESPRQSTRRADSITTPWRYLAVLLLALILIAGVLAAAAAYYLPQATITLRPQATPIQVIAGFTADPALTAAAGLAVPARPVTLEQEWQASGAATGDAAADEQRILAQAQQGLSAAAAGLLVARLDAGEWLVPASVAVRVIETRFTPADDTATLFLRAEIDGLTVRTEDLIPPALDQLAGVAGPGAAPNPAGLRLQIEPAAGDNPTAFQVTARTTSRAVIDPAALAETLRGQRLADAARYLASRPTAEAPAIDVGPRWWREWFGRLPLRAAAIRVELLP